MSSDGGQYGRQRTVGLEMLLGGSDELDGRKLVSVGNVCVS